MDKVKRKVKVYGVTSTKAIRARLIEILMERVKYHKDKFVSPLLWDEMKSMTVRPSGKVEHSDQTHDDTVFGYLMAMYVWYDGKNLVENFGIQKSTIRTDQDEELLEDNFEDALESRESVSIDNSIIEQDNDMQQTLEWVESNVGIKSSSQLYGEQYVDRLSMREVFLARDPKLNQRIIDETGVNVSPNQQYMTTTTVTLPNQLFDMDVNLDDEELADLGNKGSFSTTKSPLCGNLSSFYDFL